MRRPDFGLRGRGEAGFCMKDDPNNEVVADSMTAGNFPDMMKARRGWDADLF